MDPQATPRSPAAAQGCLVGGSTLLVAFLLSFGLLFLVPADPSIVLGVWVLLLILGIALVSTARTRQIGVWLIMGSVAALGMTFAYLSFLAAVLGG